MPFGWDEYENAAYFPSGDQAKALIVKLNANGTWILSIAGQLTGSEMQAAETLTSSMTPPTWRGWRKKYNSPVSITEPGMTGSVTAGSTWFVGCIGWDEESKAKVGGTGDPSKKEAGVGVVEVQAVRKIKARVTSRFMESPCLG